MRDSGLTHGGFYKHFGNKDDLVMESLREAFKETVKFLTQAAEQAQPGSGWKAIVKTYLSPEHCDHPERGCPLAALAPELARGGKEMRARMLAEMANYKDQMLRFMPGRRKAEKERAFFVMFSTMIGAVEIARMLPDPATRDKVLGNARDFLLHSF
jgi:TetR/AcrR family transcriptional regulator, transcriptional repressor for nem operon